MALQAIVGHLIQHLMLMIMGQVKIQLHAQDQYLILKNDFLVREMNETNL